MQIQVNTSNGIENKDTLERWADSEIRHSLSRFTGELTRVEIHFSDENHDTKGGARDKRCLMEARLPGRAPVAVTQHAENMDEAFRGACDKLKRALDSALGRFADHRDRESIRKDGGGADMQ